MKVILIIIVSIMVTSCATTYRFYERNCMTSPNLTWTGSGKIFDCKKAKNHCEKGFIQESSTEDDCTKKEGCKFEPANCYCAFYKGDQCICGGGPPSKCFIETENTLSNKPRHQPLALPPDFKMMTHI